MRTWLWVAHVYVAVVAVIRPVLQKYWSLHMLERWGHLWLGEGKAAKKRLELENMPAISPTTIWLALSLVIPPVVRSHRMVAPVAAGILALPTLVAALQIIRFRLSNPLSSGRSSYLGREPSVLVELMWLVPHGFIIWGRLGPYPP